MSAPHDPTRALLPCPFCGGEAELERSHERFEYCTGGPNSVMEWGYYVYCTKCSAGTSAVDVPPPSPEEAAAEWNQRTPVPFAIEVQPPAHVREHVALVMEGDYSADELRFVVYNDAQRDEWLQPEQEQAP